MFQRKRPKKIFSKKSSPRLPVSLIIIGLLALLLFLVPTYTPEEIRTSAQLHTSTNAAAHHFPCPTANLYTRAPAHRSARRTGHLYLHARRLQPPVHGQSGWLRPAAPHR